MFTAESPAAVNQPGIDRWFGGYDRKGEPDAAVLVLERGKTLHKKGYGLSDVGSKSKIGAQTSFDLASLTKQFTAMAARIENPFLRSR